VSQGDKLENTLGNGADRVESCPVGVAAQPGGADMAAAANGSAGARLRRIVFACLFIAWIVIDQTVKAQFADAVIGRVLAGPFAGLFDFRLVHNTGGAWGIFSGSTVALGVFAVIVCVIAGGYALIKAKELNWLEVIGFALVVAGGIGNAIDRFTLGYVVDFINLDFMSFPVFNIADIGVTCGFVLIIAGLVFDIVRDRKAAAVSANTSKGGE
jgi:signal peptidase II